MALISYRRHRFPPPIIQHAVWLYLRFTLSYRDVEELLAQRRLDLSYESVRSWVLKFGPLIARRLRQNRPGRAIAGIWTKCFSVGLDSLISARFTTGWQSIRPFHLVPLSLRRSPRASLTFRPI